MHLTEFELDLLITLLQSRMDDIEQDYEEALAIGDNEGISETTDALDVYEGLIEKLEG